MEATKSGGEVHFLTNHRQYKRLSESTNRIINIAIVIVAVVHGLPEEDSIAKESPFAPTIKDRLLSKIIIIIKL